jgi:D-glycero-alpha-D-manno-heptose-7-phosphate kinase
MIIARTPLRISFFGGGTDYSDWIQEHGGQVLSTTINKYNYITCRYLPPFFKHKYRLAYSRLEHVEKFEDIQHPSIKACIEYLKITEGIEMHYDADLPARTGLGTSSAFTVGFLNALSTLLAQSKNNHTLAKEAIHVEQSIIEEIVGSQDQVNAAFGGLNHIVFHKDGNIDVNPVALEKERLSELEGNLLLFFTGIVRTASEIAKDQVQNTSRNEPALHKMHQLVDDSLDILKGTGTLDEFGLLLHDTWQYKRSLSKKVSTEHIDNLYEKAMSAGAIGGKLLGAGGGGFMLFYVPKNKQAAVKASLSELLHVPFKFDQTGSQIIFNQHNDIN